ncbi:MAG TPA: hypothetical protein VKB12_02065 [Pyrinomonadaceae bacterium]|nr:hypothetical protein [Pyrinomonadaceae bacterium]
MSDFKEIQDRVAAVLSADLGGDRAREVGFHMADWSGDLEELHSAWNNLDGLDDEQLSKLIYKFLAHVPNHLAAAKKLIGYGPIEDTFEVGVLEEDDED